MVASSQRLVVTLSLALLASLALVNSERVFVKFGAGVGPIGNASLTWAKPAVGLFALPLDSTLGTAGVPHTRLFKFASSVTYAPQLNLLVVLYPDNAVGGVIYDTSTWTDANMADPNFNPTALWPIDPTSAGNIINGGEFDFAVASDGSEYVLATAQVTQDPSGLTRNMVFSKLNRANGQLIPSQLIGGLGQYFYYMRYRSFSGQPRDPVVYLTLDQGQDIASQVIALEVFANFSNISSPVGSVDVVEVPGGTFATFLELDGARKYAVVGYGSDGVVLVSAAEPSALTVMSFLGVSNATKTYTVGAYQACGRTNAQTSDIAWLNIDSTPALFLRNITVNVARYDPIASSPTLRQDVIIPTGFAVSCGSYATQQGRGVVIATDQEISRHDTTSTSAAPNKLGSVPAPCYESYYIGQMGKYALFHHGANSTCTCTSSNAPCPLSLEVVGNAGVTSAFVGQFGSHLVNGLHFVQPYQSASLSILTTSTLEVQLAQDAAMTSNATLAREGCGTLSNTNLAGAICLVYRGSCPFNQKIARCKAKGASAIIIVNYNNTGILNPIINTTDLVFFVTFEVGEAFRLALASASSGPSSVTVTQPGFINPSLPGTLTPAGPATPGSSTTAPPSATTVTTTSPAPSATTSTTSPAPSATTSTSAVPASPTTVTTTGTVTPPPPTTTTGPTSSLSTPTPSKIAATNLSASRALVFALVALTALLVA